MTKTKTKTKTGKISYMPPPLVLCRSYVTFLTVSGKQIFAVHGQKMLINGGKGRYTTGQVRDKKKVPKRL